MALWYRIIHPKEPLCGFLLVEVIFELSLIRFDFALALDLPNEEYYNKDYTTNLDFKGWLCTQHYLNNRDQKQSKQNKKGKGRVGFLGTS